jgi:lipopolysaccharide export system protein LptA
MNAKLRHAATAACLLVVLGTLGALAGPVAAEKADRDKPVNIEADRMRADDTKQVAVFEGGVVLTQGTFVLRADTLTVRQDGEGFQFGVAVGKPARFRQKRDGVDEWIEGEALRIEYDGRNERVELFENARVLRDKDQVRGNYIAYDTRAEVFKVQNARDPVPPRGKQDRVTATIVPKSKDGARPQGGGVDLAPSTSLGKN